MEECSICLENYSINNTTDMSLENVQKNDDTPLKLYCGHIFHSKCINATFRNREICPLCRSEYYLGTMRHHLVPYRTLPVFMEILFTEVDLTTVRPTNFNLNFSVDENILLLCILLLL